MENADTPILAAITPEAAASFRQVVYRHFRDHGRRLPWRRTADPYRLLVSEFMLQQTQVERVVLWYERFLASFPDFAALARAPLREVLLAWQGLGYNRRALALQQTAVRVVAEFGGRLPAEAEALRTLPGVGEATAGALLAFAFNQPAVFLETNIRRVYLHFFFPARGRVRDRELLPLVAQTLDRDCPRRWYWALMDYGSWLKQHAPNPNRRSAHYQKQSPFENSDRQLRSRILRMLLKESPLAQEEVERAAGQSPARVRDLIRGLVAEGFLDRSGDWLSIAEGPSRKEDKDCRGGTSSRGKSS